MALRPISVIPQGLLGALGLKVMGQNPPDLAEVIQPTIETLPLYLNSLARTVNRSRNGLGSSAQTSWQMTNRLIVPDGETWFVHNLVMQGINNAVAASVFTNLSAGFLWRTSYARVTEERLTFAGAAGVITSCSVAGEGFWAPPGAEFIAYTGQTVDAAAALDLNLSLRYTPVQA